MRLWLLFALLLVLQIQLGSVFAGCIFGSCWPSVETQTSASESSTSSPPFRSSLSGRRTSTPNRFAGYPLEWRRLVLSMTWSGVDFSRQTQNRLLTNEWEDMMYNLSPKRYFEKIKYAIRKEYEKLASDRPFHLMYPVDFGCHLLNRKECDTEIGIYMEGVEYARRAGYRITRAILAGNDDTLDFTKHESPSVLSDYYYYMVICGSKSKNKMSLQINDFSSPRDNTAEKDYLEYGSIRCDESPRHFLYATGRPKFGISSLKLKRGGWNSKAPVYVVVAYVPMRPRISTSTYPTFSSTDVNSQVEPRTIAEHLAVNAILRFSSKVLSAKRPGLFARRTLSPVDFVTRRSRLPGAYYAELFDYVRLQYSTGRISDELMTTIKEITKGHTYFYDVETTRHEQSGVHTTAIYRIHSANADRKLRVYWTCQATVPDVQSRMMMVIGFDTMGHNAEVGEQQHGPSMYMQIEDPRSGWTACDATGSGTRATVQFAEWRVGTSISSIKEFFQGVRRKLTTSFAEEFRSNFWNDYWIGFQAVTSKGPAASLRIAVQLTEQTSAAVNRRQGPKNAWDSTGDLLKDMEDSFGMDTVPVLQNGRVIYDGGGYLFRQREWELANSLANFYDTHLLYGRNTLKLDVMEKYQAPGAYQSTWRYSRPLIAPPMTFGDGTVDVYGRPVNTNEEQPVLSRTHVYGEVDAAGHAAMDMHSEDAPSSNTEPGPARTMPPLEPNTLRTDARAEEHLDNGDGQELDKGHGHDMSMTMDNPNGKQVTRAEGNAAEQIDEASRSPFSGRLVPVLQLPNFKVRKGSESSLSKNGGAIEENESVKDQSVTEDGSIRDGSMKDGSMKDGSIKDKSQDSTPKRIAHSKAVSSLKGSLTRIGRIGRTKSKDKGETRVNVQDGPPGLLSPKHGWRNSWSHGWRTPSPLSTENIKGQVKTVSKSEGNSPSVPSSKRERGKSWSNPWSGLSPLSKKDSKDKGSSVLNLEGSGPPSLRSPIHERTNTWSVPDEFSPHSSDLSG